MAAESARECAYCSVGVIALTVVAGVFCYRRFHRINEGV